MVLIRVFLALWAIVVVAQGLTIGRVELTFDEAYYALWARWPQAGYFDHPPMVAWAIAASRAMFGGGEFGVRALFWAAGAMAPGLAFVLAKRLYGDTRIAATAGLFYLGAPLVAGAPLATPDTPLTLFWTLSVLGLVEVWRGGAWGWALVGLGAGAAGLSKMTAGFLGLGVGLALLATPSLRREFARPGLYGAAALALATLSPFLWWNATHGFATFLKQGGRLEARGWAPGYLAEFVGSQFLLVNPLTAALALRGAAARRGPPDEATRLLLAISAPLLGYFVLHALHDRVQGNWPAPLYPALAVLAARAAAGRWPRGAVVASVMGLALIGALYFHLLVGLPRLGASDPTLRIGGWRTLTARVSTLAGDRKAEFIYAQNYAQTSLLQYYGGRDVFEIGEPERWSFRPPFAPEGLGLAFGRPDVEPRLRQLFAKVTLLAELRRSVFQTDLEDYFVFEVGSPKSLR